MGRTTSSGATSWRAIISRSIRNATSCSASPTWSVIRPSCPICRTATSSSRQTLTNTRAKSTLQVLVRDYGVGGESRKLVLSLDVTDRERNEAMRRDFVANVSHEIRTPLTVLAGFIETMASLQLTEAERKRVLHLMQQQTTRMQTLVGDLLTLAQLEGSPRPGADHWISLDPLLQRVGADAQALSNGRA